MTATGEGRCNLGVRWGAAWQKMMTLMLQSYMNRAQSRFSELDFAAPDEASESTAPPADTKEQLRKIEELRDEQLITEEEYQEKRQEILDRL